MKSITIVALAAKTDHGKMAFEDVVLLYAFDGDRSRDAALEQLAERMTQRSRDEHAQTYRADVENGPCAADIPDSWSVEEIKEHFHISVQQELLDA